MLFVFCDCLILGSVAKFLSEKLQNSRFLHGRRLESQATSILKGAPKRVRHTAPQPSRRRSPKEKEHKSQSHGRHPPPIPPPKPPRRVQKQVQVEAGMCRKSRDGQNTAKTDAKGDTDRKTPKKRCETDRRAGFWTVQAAVCGVFLPQTPQIPTKAEISNSISGRQPGNRHTPRGGRRTCCQQQQQQQYTYC